MHNVVAVAQGQSALLLGLAGISVVEAQQATDAAGIIGRYLRGETPARMLIVDERFAPELPERLREQIWRHRGTPLIIFCPAFEQEDEDVDRYLAALLKPVIGYEIRLE